MQPDYSEALAYVQSHLAQGFNEQQIREHFLANGWTTEQVAALFTHVQPYEYATQPIANSESPQLYSTQHTTNDFVPSTNDTNTISTTEPQKFKLFYAIKQASGAIKHNAGRYTISVLAVIVVTIILSTIVLLGAALILESLALYMGMSVGIVYMVLGLLIYSFGEAYLLLATSRALVPLSNTVTFLPIKQLIIPSKHDLWRVTKTVLAVNVIIYVPITIAIVIAIFSLFSAAFSVANSSSSLGAVFAPVFGAVIFAIMWLFITSLRLALAPFISIYEPEIKTFRTLKRSAYLLKSGGQWFIVKGFILVTLLYVLLAGATGQRITPSYNTQDVNIGMSVLFNIVMFVLYLLINAVLTFLYKNRATVRGKQ